MKPHYCLLMLCITLLGCRSTYLTVGDDNLPQYLSAENPNLPLVSAHRGGRFYVGKPENSMAVFRHVMRHVPAVLEVDVQMSRDSVLFLFHDDELNRTSTGKGLAASYQWKDLRRLRLVDDYDQVTRYRIPTLDKVLRWADEKTILALDLKYGVPPELIIDAIRAHEAEDYALIICYNLEEAEEIFKMAPDLVMSVSMPERKDVLAHEGAGIPPENCVAFTGTRLSDPTFYHFLQSRNIPSILGTMYEADVQWREGDESGYMEAREAGIQILATDHPIEVVEIIREYTYMHPEEANRDLFSDPVPRG